MAETLRHPCEQCGAQLMYAPGTTALKCPYCGHQQAIVVAPPMQVGERDYNQFVEQARLSKPTESVQLLHCNSCAAEFTLDPNKETEICPFCGSRVIVQTDPMQRIKPEAILPFGLDTRGAHEAYRKWISSRFWAPNDLKRLAMSEGAVRGMYLPFWTYDSDTVTRYTGQRGEHYWETETYRDSDGDLQTRQVQRTRWYPASGVVEVSFDDLLVQASNALPEKFASRMQTFDLPNLLPYSPDFVAGFQTVRYTRDLEEGFGVATQLMVPRIDQAIRRDIGGDDQQIHSRATEYFNVTFKHVLLPIYSGAYRYGGKSWSFLVNARTGEVHGEAPISWWKVTLAVLFGLILLGLFLWIAGRQ